MTLPLPIVSSAPPPGIGQAALLQEYVESERNFRRDHHALWLGTLVGPWVVAILAPFVVYLVCGARFTQYLLGAAILTFSFAGRFIIPMQDVSQIGPLTPEHLFWLVTYQDVLIAVFMAFHVGFLFRLPWIGPKFLELTADGELILSLQPWMRKVTFAGLVAFVAFPLANMGCAGGAIFGRLLGLSRAATFWGSLIGAVTGNVLMLYGAKFVLQYLPRDSLAVRCGGPVIILAVIVLLARRYAAMKRQFLQDRIADSGSPSATIAEVR